MTGRESVEYDLFETGMTGALIMKRIILTADSYSPSYLCFCFHRGLTSSCGGSDAAADNSEKQIPPPGERENRQQRQFIISFYYR
jgi:hypothetical protein